ncbi:SDR family oxidoreductase [Acidiferrimicrobium sp. IK]|uniref:SDR family oxidoreductase n=1 Tax=Acidiferrimicrobium sp. IK TaxID=2871700 RepID=UPI0021CAE3D9|nr:SDR family oxidoreductase [Acidiferrimicrobium sp. IK]MCU4182756.1 SDR family oxidoreductase [Acidiferrimicrobium sp. IK]
MLLEGKVVVISGVGSGLGRSLALQCARAGADVVLAARTADRLDAVAKEVAGFGRRALAVPSDINEETAPARLAAQALEGFGRVDGLVNNAFAMPPIRELGKVDPVELRGAFETNVLGALRVTRQLAPALEDARGAAVMINSAVLRHSQRGFGPYKVTKAALLAATQALATELGPRQVRVNSVAPGYIWGDNLKWWFSHLAERQGTTPEQVYEEAASSTDLRRLPEPDEVADAVVFLLSDLARAVTGQCLDVNCGEYHH